MTKATKPRGKRQPAAEQPDPPAAPLNGHAVVRNGHSVLPPLPDAPPPPVAESGTPDAHARNVAAEQTGDALARLDERRAQYAETADLYMQGHATLDEVEAAATAFAVDKMALGIGDDGLEAIRAAVAAKASGEPIAGYSAKAENVAAGAANAVPPDPTTQLQQSLLDAIRMLWAVLSLHGGQVRVSAERLNETIGDIRWAPDPDTGELVITAVQPQPAALAGEGGA